MAKLFAVGHIAARVTCGRDLLLHPKHGGRHVTNPEAKPTWQAQ